MKTLQLALIASLLPGAVFAAPWDGLFGRRADSADLANGNDNGSNGNGNGNGNNGNGNGYGNNENGNENIR